MMDKQVFLLLGKQDKGNKEKQFSRKKLDFWMSETEDGDSDGGHDDENDDDDCDGDSIVVDDDIHEGSTVDFEAVRERVVLLRWWRANANHELLVLEVGFLPWRYWQVPIWRLAAQ